MAQQRYIRQVFEVTTSDQSINEQPHGLSTVVQRHVAPMLTADPRVFGFDPNMVRKALSAPLPDSGFSDTPSGSISEGGGGGRHNMHHPATTTTTTTSTEPYPMTTHLLSPGEEAILTGEAIGVGNKELHHGNHVVVSDLTDLRDLCHLPEPLNAQSVWASLLLAEAILASQGGRATTTPSDVTATTTASTTIAHAAACTTAASGFLNAALFDALAGIRPTGAAPVAPTSTAAPDEVDPNATGCLANVPVDRRILDGGFHFAVASDKHSGVSSTSVDGGQESSSPPTNYLRDMKSRAVADHDVLSPAHERGGTPPPSQAVPFELPSYAEFLKLYRDAHDGSLQDPGCHNGDHHGAGEEDDPCRETRRDAWYREVFLPTVYHEKEEVPHHHAAAALAGAERGPFQNVHVLRCDGMFELERCLSVQCVGNEAFYLSVRETLQRFLATDLEATRAWLHLQLNAQRRQPAPPLQSVPQHAVLWLLLLYPAVHDAVWDTVLATSFPKREGMDGASAPPKPPSRDQTAGDGGDGDAMMFTSAEDVQQAHEAEVSSLRAMARARFERRCREAGKPVPHRSKPSAARGGGGGGGGGPTMTTTTTAPPPPSLIPSTTAAPHAAGTVPPPTTTTKARVEVDEREDDMAYDEEPTWYFDETNENSNLFFSDDQIFESKAETNRKRQRAAAVNASAESAEAPGSAPRSAVAAAPRSGPSLDTNNTESDAAGQRLVIRFLERLVVLLTTFRKRFVPELLNGGVLSPALHAFKLALLAHAFNRPLLVFVNHRAKAVADRRAGAGMVESSRGILSGGVATVATGRSPSEKHHPDRDDVTTAMAMLTDDSTCALKLHCQPLLVMSAGVPGPEEDEAVTAMVQATKQLQTTPFSGSVLAGRPSTTMDKLDVARTFQKDVVVPWTDVEAATAAAAASSPPSPSTTQAEHSSHYAQFQSPSGATVTAYLPFFTDRMAASAIVPLLLEEYATRGRQSAAPSSVTSSTSTAAAGSTASPSAGDAALANQQVLKLFTEQLVVRSRPPPPPSFSARRRPFFLMTLPEGLQYAPEAELRNSIYRERAVSKTSAVVVTSSLPPTGGGGASHVDPRATSSSAAATHVVGSSTTARFRHPHDEHPMLSYATTITSMLPHAAVSNLLEQADIRLDVAMPTARLLPADGAASVADQGRQSFCSPAPAILQVMPFGRGPLDIILRDPPPSPSDVSGKAKPLSLQLSNAVHHAGEDGLLKLLPDTRPPPPTASSTQAQRSKKSLRHYQLVLVSPHDVEVVSAGAAAGHQPRDAAACDDSSKLLSCTFLCEDHDKVPPDTLATLGKSQPRVSPRVRLYFPSFRHSQRLSMLPALDRKILETALLSTPTGVNQPPPPAGGPSLSLDAVSDAPTSWLPFMRFPALHGCLKIHTEEGNQLSQSDLDSWPGWGIDRFAANYVDDVISKQFTNAAPVYAEPDGHCLLHAVSRSLCGSSMLYHVLRSALYDYMRTHRHYFKAWMCASEGLSGLAEEMDQLALRCHADYIEGGKGSAAMPDPSSQPSGQSGGSSAKRRRAGVEESRGLGHEHIFVLAHMLRRPIILIDSGNTKAFMRDALIFLPLGLPPSDCATKNAIVIAWSHNAHHHFVPVIAIDPQLPSFALVDALPRRDEDDLQAAGGGGREGSKREGEATPPSAGTGGSGARSQQLRRRPPHLLLYGLPDVLQEAELTWELARKYLNMAWICNETVIKQAAAPSSSSSAPAPPSDKASSSAVTEVEVEASEVFFIGGEHTFPTYLLDYWTTFAATSYERTSGISNIWLLNEAMRTRVVRRTLLERDDTMPTHRSSSLSQVPSKGSSSSKLDRSIALSSLVSAAPPAPGTREDGASSRWWNTIATATAAVVSSHAHIHSATVLRGVVERMRHTADAAAATPQTSSTIATSSTTATPRGALRPREASASAATPDAVVPEAETPSDTEVALQALPPWTGGYWDAKVTPENISLATSGELKRCTSCCATFFRRDCRYSGYCPVCDASDAMVDVDDRTGKVRFGDASKRTVMMPIPRMRSEPNLNLWKNFAPSLTASSGTLPRQLNHIGGHHSDGEIIPVNALVWARATSTSALCIARVKRVYVLARCRRKGAAPATSSSFPGAATTPISSSSASPVVLQPRECVSTTLVAYYFDIVFLETGRFKSMVPLCDVYPGFPADVESVKEQFLSDVTFRVSTIADLERGDRVNSVIEKACAMVLSNFPSVLVSDFKCIHVDDCYDELVARLREYMVQLMARTNEEMIRQLQILPDDSRTVRQTLAAAGCRPGQMVKRSQFSKRIPNAVVWALHAGGGGVGGESNGQPHASRVDFPAESPPPPASRRYTLVPWGAGTLSKANTSAPPPSASEAQEKISAAPKKSPPKYVRFVHPRHYLTDADVPGPTPDSPPTKVQYEYRWESFDIVDRVWMAYDSRASAQIDAAFLDPNEAYVQVYIAAAGTMFKLRLGNLTQLSDRGGARNVRRMRRARIVETAGGGPTDVNRLAPSPSTADIIACEVCTFDNSAHRSVCEMCESPLPRRSGGGGGVTSSAIAVTTTTRSASINTSWQVSVDDDALILDAESDERLNKGGQYYKSAMTVVTEERRWYPGTNPTTHVTVYFNEELYPKTRSFALSPDGERFLGVRGIVRPGELLYDVLEELCRKQHNGTALRGPATTAIFSKCHFTKQPDGTYVTIAAHW